MKLLAALKKWKVEEWVGLFLITAIISIMMFAIYMGFKQSNYTDDMVEWCVEEGGVPIIGEGNRFRMCIDADAVIRR